MSLTFTTNNNDQFFIEDIQPDLIAPQLGENEI